jgi:hypothetical protein
MPQARGGGPSNMEASSSRGSRLRSATERPYRAASSARPGGRRRREQFFDEGIFGAAQIHHRHPQHFQHAIRIERAGMRVRRTRKAPAVRRAGSACRAARNLPSPRGPVLTGKGAGSRERGGVGRIAPIVCLFVARSSPSSGVLGSGKVKKTGEISQNSPMIYPDRCLCLGL